MSKLLAGRYELVDKIGEGGMAVVYKAKDRLLNRFVAIKILRPEFTKDETFVESFKRESQAAAGLQHPNIVAVYDVGRSGSINYIVMELIDGKPLSDIIEEKAPLDYKVVIDIGKQMAAALSLAHKHDIIHRDVKPHNILITQDGTAKLADFGIAKAVSDSTIVSDTSRVIGSVHYFSPEQARGAYVDERSDIYSLGIVMYEMLTGRVPFDGDNPVEVALKHINQDIMPPSKLVPGIPPALEKLVMKATDKFQTNRYKSADEMLEDLKNIEFVSQVMGSGVFAAASGGSATADLVKQEEGRSGLAELPKDGRRKAEHGSGGKGSDEDRRKKKLVIALVSAAAILLVLIVLLLRGVIGGRGQSDEIVLPDLTNRTYDQAKEILEAKGLKIEKGEEVYDDQIIKGSVVSQQPKADTKVKPGRTITVTVSKGPKEPGIVPKLVGKMYTSKAELNETLKPTGFSIGTITEEESDEETGTIIRQTPDAGESANEGTRIDIVVAKKKADPKVPNLSGMTESEAEAAVITNGFTTGEVNYEESNTVEEGRVIRQSPEAYSDAEPGTKIYIWVSKMKTYTVPDVASLKLTLEQARAMLESAEGAFSVSVVYAEGYDESSPDLIVTAQNPEAGSSVTKGSTVTLTLGPDPDAPPPGGDDGGGGDDQTNP